MMCSLVLPEVIVYCPEPYHGPLAANVEKAKFAGDGTICRKS
jgi:hypothetical protein